jgi:hypothetical protein
MYITSHTVARFRVKIVIRLYGMRGQIVVTSGMHEIYRSREI